MAFSNASDLNAHLRGKCKLAIRCSLTFKPLHVFEHNITTEALLILATSRQKFKKHDEMQTKSDLPLSSPATVATLLIHSSKIWKFWQLYSNTKYFHFTLNTWQKCALIPHASQYYCKEKHNFNLTWKSVLASKSATSLMPPTQQLRSTTQNWNHGRSAFMGVKAHIKQCMTFQNWSQLTK